MNSQPLDFVPASEFKQRAADAVADDHLRKSFRGAMDFLIGKRAAQFPDAAALESQRSLAEHIRKYSLARLPELLEQLERKLTDNGVQVHWAETGEEACAIIVGIAQRHSTKLMVKGKSMVSEEVELNHAMADAGIDALESDMGEYIVQLDGEKPSHIIMPAIHKTKQQIARLFADKVPGAGYTESVDELIGIGRAVLREKFMFLFDEPLSNLDAKLRVQMRAEIKALHQRLKTTTVYVTHDQVEAMTMADKIVVMRDGIVEQVGSPLDLYDRPANMFVAGFIGSPAMNFIEGSILDGVFVGDGLTHSLAGLPDDLDGQSVVLGIRPEHIELADAGPAATVVLTEQTGSETNIHLKLGANPLNCLAKGRIAVEPGQSVHLRMQPGKVHLFDARTGKR
ncbi:LUD domain-containing protein, partial [Accumulibacter sp.]|uniref:LUD domain-containing protein n=1 Tax=Accumulibacter sp. TaxID=2053492 RepID=UPI0025BC063D